MKNILDKIPATIKNIAILCFGILLLLHAFNFFQEAVTKAIIIIGILMIVYAFIELGGPSKVMSLFGKKNADDNKSVYRQDSDPDDDLF